MWKEDVDSEHYDSGLIWLQRCKEARAYSGFLQLRKNNGPFLPMEGLFRSYQTVSRLNGSYLFCKNTTSFLIFMLSAYGS